MRAYLWLGLRPSSRRSEDSLLCDLGDQRTWSEALATATLLQAQHATAPVGLALTPLLAAWAAHGAAPGQLRVVSPEQDAQAAALASIPLAGLPGLALPFQGELCALRVFTLGELAGLPTALLTAVFGRVLLPFQALARGADPRWVPITLADARLTTPSALATVRRTLPVSPHQPLTPTIMARELDALTAGVAAALTITGRAATHLTLTLGYPTGDPLTRRLTCTAPTATPATLRAVVAAPLAAGLRARRRQPVWLELAVTHATDLVHQPALPLPAAAPDPAGLATAIATIHQRFGAHVLHQGLPLRSYVLHPPARP